MGGLVTDVQPRTEVAAPAQPLDHAIQVAGERAVVPHLSCRTSAADGPGTTSTSG